jgi:hypothetical protein
MQTNKGRTVITYLTNNSSGVIAYGDVCVMKGTTALDVTNAHVADFIDGVVCVCLDPGGVASGQKGMFASGGYVPQINLDASASLLDLIKVSATNGQGTPHAAPAGVGDFAQVLGTGSSPEAILFGMPSIGGGSEYAGSVEIPMWSPDAGSWLITSTAFMDYYVLSSGAINDYLTWNIYMPSGTYTWRLDHSTSSNRGKYHLLIDGTDAAQIEGYSATDIIKGDKVTGISITGNASVEITIKMASKNTSSLAYYGVIFRSFLTRTG